MNEKKTEKLEEKKPVKKEKSFETVKIRSKLNRHFDLHIGKETISFDAHETKEIPKIFLLQKKWERVKKYFVRGK